MQRLERIAGLLVDRLDFGLLVGREVQFLGHLLEVVAALMVAFAAPRRIRGGCGRGRIFGTEDGSGQQYKAGKGKGQFEGVFS